MSDYVRGSNPIWFEVDLSANAFDDSFYLFVLENTLPYVPATVYHDPDGNVPWTNPIQFLANGTLPPDIFFDPDVVYRLEFRQGNTNSDPLIYLVENYQAGGAGSSPIDNVALPTDNQITNPQFSLISFESSFALTSVTDPDPIEVAPGWFLELEGTGNVTLERLSLNNALENTSNAPYALRITLSGTWTGTPYLRQRFNQNGMLWSNKYVSNAITARVEGSPISISARLDDSNGQPLVEVLESTVLSDNFEEYTGYGLVPATTNPDLPPDAYIEYKLFLPTSCDIYVTSFQLVASEVAVEYGFEQDTIERQQDHTFHYYRESLLRQPKNSLLTGWNFANNPWQFQNTNTTNVATNTYTADQTIIVQQAYVASASGNNVSTARAPLSQNYGFKVTAVTSTNQFAMIQYVDPKDMRQYWGKTLSAMVQLEALRQNTALDLRMKMRLAYRSSLPPTIAQAEPIATWAANGEPVLAAGWTEIEPQNDPVYNLPNGVDTLLFEKFVLPASDNANMTLAVILYTVDSMIETGTADYIVFNKVSLVQNDFAIETADLTWEEDFKRCQYHYSKSFAFNVLPATGAGVANMAPSIQVSPASTANAVGPYVMFPVEMRAVPAITLYNPGNTNNQIRNTGASQDWSNSAASTISTTGFISGGTTPAVSNAGNNTGVHWTANARLGS